MQYRIKYSLYRIEARSVEEAKKKALSILGSHLDDFVTVELSVEKRPLWKMLLTGH